MKKLKEFFYLAIWWTRAVFFGRRKPLQSVIFISDRCNLSCKHCAVYNHRNPQSKTYAQICEELAYCYAQGSRFVDFEGGEPFLWRGTDENGTECNVNDLCRLARSMGFFSCTITTNAQEPFDGSVADSIWVSMDGVGDYHDLVRGKGAFARLEKNIATCGCKDLSANMVVNTLNHESLVAAIEYVKQNPYLKSLSVNLHTPFPGTEELALPKPLHDKVLDTVLAYKKRGYPIMNSKSGLKKMRSNNFKKRCWMTNFIYTDGSRSAQCIGADMNLCGQCGFCMAGEEASVFALCPDTLFAGLKLRA